MKNTAVFLLALALILGTCKSKNPADQAGSEEAAAAVFKQYELVEAWKTDTLLLVPECVIYDMERDVVYVSNMNNEPRLKDGNGFISRLSTSGEIFDLKWVADMSSPKGLELYEGKLYVSDVDEVIVIDIEAEEIVERIPVDGSKMINDLAFDRKGDLYISDSDDNSIFLYSDGLMSKWAEGLEEPNGLLVDGEKLLLASMGSSDLVSFNLETKEKTLITENINKGDGIAGTGIPGHYLVTDWFGEVFMVYPDGSKASLLDTKEAEIGTADIEFVEELDLLIIPTFYKQHVAAYKLVEKE